MGVSRSRVYQLAAAKEIPTVMVGGRILIPRTAWEEWLRRKTAEAWTENTEANNG
jgi:excisionase family DNA binding protein